MRLNEINLRIGTFLLFLMALHSQAPCQSISLDVLCASSNSGTGVFASGQSFCMDWTIGEAVVETVNSTQVLLTQGFHQYDDKVRCDTIVSSEAGAGEFSISPLIFPNPTADVLGVRCDLMQYHDVILVLTDLKGNTVFYKALQTAWINERIPLEHVSAGEYFLRIILADGTLISTNKIIKITR